MYVDLEGMSSMKSRVGIGIGLQNNAWASLATYMTSL